MHNTAFAHYGLPDRYGLWSITDDELPSRIAALREMGMRGANVTIPYKFAAMEFVDDLGLDPDVAALGALNTIVRRPDGSLFGTNTDVLGFLQALATGGYDPTDGDVVLIGAGGAARAVVWGLVHAGVRSISVIARTPMRAEALLQGLITTSHQHLTWLTPDDTRVRDVVASANLLVNATPVGSDGIALPLAPDLLHAGLFVSDLIYRTTPLLEAAAACGARTQDGLEMLVQQGALAFEAWTGLPAPVDLMRQAALDMRGT